MPDPPVVRSFSWPYRVSVGLSYSVLPGIALVVFPEAMVRVLPQEPVIPWGMRGSETRSFKRDTDDMTSVRFRETT